MMVRDLRVICIIVFLTASFLLSACSSGHELPTAKKTATLAPKNADSFSAAVLMLRLSLHEKDGYQLFVSTEKGYRGEYVEIRRDGDLLLDFVEIPNTNNYAVAIYDVSSVPKDGLSSLNGAFERNYFEVKSDENDRPQIIELNLSFQAKK